MEKKRGQAPETISASTAAGMTAMAVDPTAVGSEERGVPAAAAEGRGPEEPEEAELGTLPTERRNPATTHIDTVSTLEMVAMLQRENLRAVAAVGEILPQIAQAVDQVAAALEAGGRLIYMGAGTSGRLGVLDAAECPPTFGVDPGLVVGLIAGGRDAVFQAAEGAEDRPEKGRRDLEELGLTAKDVVAGVAASGRTPYVLGGLAYAGALGCLTLAITSNPGGPMDRAASIALSADTGAEAVTGSTRLKAGTAHKLILNMISTGAMIRTGKVYENLMVNVRATNQKLRDRATRILAQITGLDPEICRPLLESHGFDIRSVLEEEGGTGGGGRRG